MWAPFTYVLLFIHLLFYIEYLFWASPVNTELKGMIPALIEVTGLWENQACKQVITAIIVVRQSSACGFDSLPTSLI